MFVLIGLLATRNTEVMVGQSTAKQQGNGNDGNLASCHRVHLMQAQPRARREQVSPQHTHLRCAVKPLLQIQPHSSVIHPPHSRLLVEAPSSLSSQLHCRHHQLHGAGAAQAGQVREGGGRVLVRHHQCDYYSLHHSVIAICDMHPHALDQLLAGPHHLRLWSAQDVCERRG